MSLKAWAIVVGVVLAVLIALGLIERHAGAIAAVFQHQRDSLQIVVQRTQHEADSLAKIRHVDSLRDTVYITRLHVKEDTVLKHLTDTVQVKEYVYLADSTIAACRLELHDCDSQRAVLQAELQAVEGQRELYKRQMPSLFQRNEGTVVGLASALAFIAGVWVHR